MTGTEAERPAYATRACYLAIALILGFGVLNVIVTFSATDLAGSSAPTAAKVVSGIIAMAELIAGLAAATRTLNGSNGWRITLIVFGWLTVVHGLSLILLGSLAHMEIHVQDVHGSTVTGHLPWHRWWIVWGALWAVGAATCSIWLARKDVAAWTSPPVPVRAAPAGWYPGPDGVPHYWTGTQWASQLPPPTDPT